MPIWSQKMEEMALTRVQFIANASFLSQCRLIQGHQRLYTSVIYITS